MNPKKPSKPPLSETVEEPEAPSSETLEDPELEKQVAKDYSLRRVGLKLLQDHKMEVDELNTLIQELSEPQCNTRGLLQHLLKKRKIKIEDFFELEQGNWTEVQEMESLYRFRLQKGKPQFYLEQKQVKTFGKYQILQEIARGGVGIVYKVYHPSLNQIFALKVLIAGEDASERTLKRFHREIQSVAKLKHPGIIQINDSGQEGGKHYFVMEFIEGKTLTDAISDGLSIRDGLLLMKKCLEALHYAHEQSIIHRDLKPDNIFVTKDGIPKIGDFGLAKDLSHEEHTQTLTHKGSIIGTPAYMSPEQASGDTENLDAISDVYSMGACLYQMLTQKRPFESPNLQVLLHKIQQVEPVPPSRFNSAIHRDLETIVLKSLEKNRAKRYASAKALGDDIGRFLDGYPIEARPASKTEQIVKWGKRNRQKTALAILMLVLFTFFPIYFSWLRHRDQQRQEQQAEAVRKKQFSLALEKAKQEEVLAQSLSSSVKNRVQDPVLGKKIQHLISALNSLNHALRLYPQEIQTEEHKKKISELLIHLCCDTQDYQLAQYVANELQNLSVLSEQEKSELQQYVQTQQTKILKQHQETLTNWIRELKKPVQKQGNRERALREISKMPEEEIFQQLLALVEEGTRYFLQNPQRNTREEEFYHTMTTALGWQENPNAGAVLMNSLRKMVEKLSYFSEDKQPIADTQYMVTLAGALRDIKAHEFSEELYKLMQKMGPDSLFSQRSLGVYRELSSMAHFSSGVLENAEDYNDRGAARFEREDYEGAVADFNEAIQKDPKNAGYYNNRGAVYHALGKWPQAIEDFSQALVLNPKDDDAYNNRGSAKYAMNDFDGAIADFMLSIEYNPKNVRAYDNRANAKQGKKDMLGAVEDHTLALQINPRYLMAYVNRARAFRSLERLPEALIDLNRAIEFDPQNYLAYVDRGEIREKMEDVDGAIDDFTEALRLNPKEISAYLQRGNAKMSKTNFASAIQDFTAVLQIDPNNARAYFGRGLSRLSTNDSKNALHDLKKLFQLTKNNQEEDLKEVKRNLIQMFPELAKE